jgi:hypothetical protein
VKVKNPNVPGGQARSGGGLGPLNSIDGIAILIVVVLLVWWFISE